MTSPPLNARDIFDRAHELKTPHDRQAYLDEVCAGAPEVRRNVESLLRAYDDAGSLLLDRPAVPLDFTGAYESGREKPVNSLTDPKTTDHLPAKKPHIHIDQIDEEIGPYKLVKKLGEGGMGVVYLARQDRPIRREVALKIIRTGIQSAQVIARFEAERQALTLMNHVNIAHVFDAGATETGQPYFVMELIKGMSFNRYCNETKLSIRDRLRLFVSVCHAVQHAHQKGIIHRDLKPGNVLVTVQDGVPLPKIIDFGLAKATEQPLTEQDHLTQIGLVLGTPEYMSPEQANGGAEGIDTRTDVYSLGVMLFELITGTVPLDRGLPRGNLLEVVKRIVNEVPPKPSDRLGGLGEKLATVADVRKADPRTFAKQVRGELDWITLKALEKDRERRYKSAEHFALDVERYLKDERVEAFPPTWRYLLGKLVRRNLAWVVVGGVLVIAVAIALAGLGIGYFQASSAEIVERGAKHRAQEALEKVQTARRAENNAYTTFFDGLRSLIRQQALPVGQTKTVLKKMLDQYKQLARLKDEAWGGDRDRQAETAFRAATLSALVGSRDQAEADYRKAIELYESLASEFSETPVYRNELGRCYFDLAFLYLQKGFMPEAETALRRAIPLYSKLTIGFPEEVGYTHELADCFNNLGVLLRTANKLNDAEAAYREAIALGQKTLALAPKMVDNLENPNLVYYRFSLAACYQNLGNIVRDRDNPSDGLERYDKAFGLLNPMMDRPDEATVCLRNVCWDRANAHDQLGNHVRANEDWRNAITFNGNAEPDGTQLRLFPAANQMEIKLLSQPKPSVSLFYEAAVLNAEALAAAKQADEVSLQAYYARRSLEFLKQADAAGWFQDQLKLKQFIGDKRFEALPSAALRKFVEGLDFKMKVKG